MKRAKVTVRCMNCKGTQTVRPADGWWDDDSKIRCCNLQGVVWMHNGHPRVDGPFATVQP